MSIAESPHTDSIPSVPDEAVELVWAARNGIADHASVVYDSSNTIVLALDGDDPHTDSDARRTHERAARQWAKGRATRLPDVDTYLVFEGTFDTDWSRRVAETYDRPLAMLDYEVDFHDPKWDQYDVSITARADIPGLHGTLRKELKVQGFATHRPDAADEVRMWQSLEHVETGHVFYENREESYSIPDARSQPSYPFPSALMVGLYRPLFEDLQDYHERIDDTFTLCERCGVFDESHGENGVPVMQAIDPDSFWKCEYCAKCYAQVIHNEYGVLPEVARLYVARERGASVSELARETGNSPQWVSRMLDRLTATVERGEDF